MLSENKISEKQTSDIHADESENDNELLIETDTPDNTMGMDEHIARLSKIMSMSCTELESITLRNAMSLLP